MSVGGETEGQRQRRLQRRREEEGFVALRAALEFLKNCVGDETVAYAHGGLTPWTRPSNQFGNETRGSVFDRKVLKNWLPTRISAIEADANAKGFKWANKDALGHVAWSFSRGYVTVNGTLARLRVDLR